MYSSLAPTGVALPRMPAATAHADIVGAPATNVSPSSDDAHEDAARTGEQSTILVEHAQKTGALENVGPSLADSEDAWQRLIERMTKSDARKTSRLRWFWNLLR